MCAHFSTTYTHGIILVRTVNKHSGLDTDTYFPFDDDYEGRGKLSMRSALARRDKAKTGLFTGITVLVSPNVQPSPLDIQQMVECAGGVHAVGNLSNINKAVPSKTIMLSSQEDLSPLLSSVKKKKLSVFTTSWLTHGLIDSNFARPEFVLHRGSFHGLDVD